MVAIIILSTVGATQSCSELWFLRKLQIPGSEDLGYNIVLEMQISCNPSRSDRDGAFCKAAERILDSRCSRPGGAITDKQEGDIVNLAGAARKLLNGIENRFL